jgi:sugar phosphate isomerase/epimerase
MSLKNAELGFRLGTTSCIYQESLIANVRKLKDQVDDIELTLFEQDSGHNYPSKKQIKELAAIAKDYKLSYTVHLPLNLEFAAGLVERRKRSIEKTLCIIDSFRKTPVFAYIVHCNFLSRIKNISHWQNRAADSLEQLVQLSGLASGSFAVENLRYPFDYIGDIARAKGLSFCVDTGHVVMNGFDLAEHFKQCLNNTRVVHFHGVYKGKDHCSLERESPEFIRKVLTILKTKKFNGVLTLEVFSWDDFTGSVKAMREAMKQF